MKRKKIIEFFKDAIGGDYIRSYNGRYCYDRSLAISCDNIEDFMLDVFGYANANNSCDHYCEKGNLFNEIHTLLRSMCVETLGRGFIVYFPQIKYKD